MALRCLRGLSTVSPRLHHVPSSLAFSVCAVPRSRGMSGSASATTPAPAASRPAVMTPSAFVTTSRRFAGRSVVVTGGAGGIGEGVVRQIVAEGGRVVVMDVLTTQGEALAAELSASGRMTGGTAVFIKCDVSDEDGVEAAFAAAVAALGAPIEVLVTLAANFVYKEVHEATHADWDRALAVNIKGTAACIKAVIPGMRQLGRGAVVTTASITGTTAFPGFVPYSATKAAIIQMTRDMALDNGRFGVRVNCCAPGPIFTYGGTVAHAARTGQDLDRLCDDLASDVALRRMGGVIECAKAFAFLASDDASYVTGTTLQCDGGFFRK